MPPHLAQPADTDRFAYDHATAALARQHQVLDSLRARAGTLLSGAAISTSFLGGQALAAGSLHLMSWIAIACFAIVGGTSTAVLWPRLALEMPPPPAVASRVRAGGVTGHPIEALLLAVADHLELAYERNEACIARIATYLRMGAVFLTLEVVWWVADLAVRA